MFSGKTQYQQRSNSSPQQTSRRNPTVDALTLALRLVQQSQTRQPHLEKKGTLWKQLS